MAKQKKNEKLLKANGINVRIRVLNSGERDSLFWTFRWCCHTSQCTQWKTIKKKKTIEKMGASCVRCERISMCMVYVQLAAIGIHLNAFTHCRLNVMWHFNAAIRCQSNRITHHFVAANIFQFANGEYFKKKLCKKWMQKPARAKRSQPNQTTSN